MCNQQPLTLKFPKMELWQLLSLRAYEIKIDMSPVPYKKKNIWVCAGTNKYTCLKRKLVDVPTDLRLPTTTMFFSCLLFLASVHSFTFVAATPEPLITAAPLLKRDIADGSSTDPILATQSFDYSALPEKVNPFNSSRGTQTGYNICNSSTEGPKSDCQTLIATNIVRFPFYAVSVVFNNSAV